MSVEALVARYGLAAIFFGAGIEGETAVVVGGLLAHQGLLTLPGVMIAAAAGSFAADQGLFALGRRYRDARWVKKIRERAGFARALELLEKHPRAFVFGFRFIYGIRTVSPVAIGTSRVKSATFWAVNAVAAVLWAVLFATLGFLFGNGLTRLFGNLGQHRDALFAIGAVVILLVAALGFVRWRRR